jgi:hypothetical protein
MDSDVGVGAVALNIDTNIAEKKEATKIAFSFDDFEGVEGFARLEEKLALDDFGAGSGVAFYGDISDGKRGSVGEG